MVVPLLGAICGVFDNSVTVLLPCSVSQTSLPVEARNRGPAPLGNGMMASLVVVFTLPAVIALMGICTMSEVVEPVPATHTSVPSLMTPWETTGMVKGEPVIWLPVAASRTHISGVESLVM